MVMKFNLKVDYLGKTENKHEAEKDMYHLAFKTYNATIEGKFERSHTISNCGSIKYPTSIVTMAQAKKRYVACRRCASHLA